MLLRTDMAFGYEYAFASDLLTVIVRSDTHFRPKTDPEGEAEKSPKQLKSLLARARAGGGISPATAGWYPSKEPIGSAM